MNLLNTVKDVFTDALMDKVSDMLGLSSKDTSSALDTFLPGLLGGIAQKGSTLEGSNSILDIINKGNFKDNSYFDLEKVLGKESKTTGFLEMGSNLLGSLFGGKQSGLLDLLLSKSGLNKAAGSKMMSFLAPVILKKISEIVFKKKFDAKGLMDLMSNEKKSLLGLIPGLSSFFANDKETKHSATYENTNKDENSGGNWWKWLIPLLILLGLIWLLSRTGCGNKDEVKTNTEDVSKTSDEDKTDNNDTKIIDGTNDMKYAGDETLPAKTGDDLLNLKDFNVNANGDIVDRNGKILVPIGFYGLDSDGNLVDSRSRVIAKAGSYSPSILEKFKGHLGKYSTVKLTLDADGNIVDPTGKILYKKGDYVEKDGFYYDKQGTKLGRIWAKIVKAVKNTTESMKQLFSNMLTKKEGAESVYTLNNITFKKDDHRITNFSKEEVEGLASALKLHPNSKIKVNVYSNEGEKVSKLRANVVHDMLVALGVSKSQISFEGKGKSDSAKADNDKVEILVD